MTCDANDKCTYPELQVKSIDSKMTLVWPKITMNRALKTLY